MGFERIKKRLFKLNSRFGDPYENRTRVTAVKGRCLNRLTNGPYIKPQLPKLGDP